MVKCRNCGGKGYIDYERYGRAGCTTCEGTGVVYPEPKEGDAYIIVTDKAAEGMGRRASSTISG